ncbi:MAG: phenylalanine 4-monooxygenase [Proteobacteria bacterium]|nr:phenylalanine 4-monooxygenase [Pseudomonadota bacterium]
MAKGDGKYISKEPDAQGNRAYTAEEHLVWRDLYNRQEKLLPGLAAQEYLDALEKLGLPRDRVPQLNEVSATLLQHTGWQVEGVPALISFKKFFTLLEARKFPAATFIRLREEFDYLQEPDIFHEIYGHCPLLTNKIYADFMQKYGEIGLKVAKEDRAMLARLYWFTVEFGLMKKPEGMRIYGAGILSSVGESDYALNSGIPEYRKLDLVDVFRTPYRIDIYQPVYFVINGFNDLYNLVKDENVLLDAIREARSLGEHAPKFPPKEAGLQAVGA